MKRILYNIIWICSLSFFIISCDPKEEELELTAPPTEKDAAFTYAASEESENIIQFSNASSGFTKKWDFGNGATAEGSEVVGEFPLKGTYEVSLTLENSAGSATSTQSIEIAETDPMLLDLPVYNLLTGGADQVGGKSWVVDASRAGHFGLGPNTEFTPDWYAAKANEKEGGGIYNDTYTFILEDFRFEWETNGDVYLNSAQAEEFENSEESPVGDFIAPYEAPEDLSWSVKENKAGDQFITISNGFIGYYTGVSTYQILELTEDELLLRFLDTKNPEFAWYLRLIPEGSTPSEPEPEPEPQTTTLPVDFEGAAPPFNGFGGTAFQVVDNPDASGINTSAKVGEYVKGSEGNWAGIETALENPLDFSSKTLIKYKVYSPVAGRALFKLETTDGSADPVEVFAEVTKTNEWEELTFDFSEAASGTFDKVALFLDFDNNNGGTFYIDDIRQVAEEGALTEEALTGGAAKSWVLKPAAGSFGVGPAKGSLEWWPGDQDISEERACLFNDEFIFKTGGEYEYKANGDIYAEAYMGVAEGCQDESILTGTDAEAWASATHSFTFTEATETEPATITVSGTGAFITLPKAFNGGEYEAAPPAADGAVTYEVLSYVKNGDTETLAIAVDISGDGSGFWNFVLIAQ